MNYLALRATQYETEQFLHSAQFRITKAQKELSLPGKSGQFWGWNLDL